MGSPSFSDCLSSWVKLNVGGRIFSTSVTTLLNAGEDSMLFRMFGPEQMGLRPCQVDSSGAYMIDRSPVYFEPLLNFLRTNQMILDAGVNPAGVLEEARYFGVEAAVAPLQHQLLYWRQQTQEPGAGCQPLGRSQVVSALMGANSDAMLRFQGVDFSDADLSSLDLRNINFKYACLRRCNLEYANLSDCCLERANLSGAKLDHALLCRVRMTCANMEGASLRHCDFQDPTGSVSANLESVNMKSAVLTGSNLTSVDLRVATLKNAVMLDCCLRMAVLAGADLENCDLSGSDLHETNLRGANLKNAAFELMVTPIHMSQTLR